MSSTIQARFGEDAYPIGRLVLDRAQALGVSRTELVRRLGYQKLNNGHRALAGLLLAGKTPPFMAENLAAALKVEQDLIDTVLLATARQRHDEARTRILEGERTYRDSFRPHLRVETERQIPSPIFVAALLTTARLRIVRLPDKSLTSSEDDQDRIVKEVIVDHYRDQGGQVPAFGAITGYVLVLLTGYDGTDFGWPFDVNGSRSGPMRKVERLPEATLGTKRGDMRLTGLLRNSPIRVLPVGVTSDTH